MYSVVLLVPYVPRIVLILYLAQVSSVLARLIAEDPFLKLWVKILPCLRCALEYHFVHLLLIGSILVQLGAAPGRLPSSYTVTEVSSWLSS